MIGSFCFFSQKEALSYCSFLRKKNQKLSLLGAIRVHPMTLGRTLEALDYPQPVRQNSWPAGTLQP
jgi:hypothetical protein